jgi:hypothetical protein
MPKVLLKYSVESSLMDITIKYGKETFTFNLYQETKIALSSTQEAKTHPPAYAFLTMLNDNLTRKVSDKENEVKRLYSKLYLKYKERNNAKTQRPNSDDMARELVINNKTFQALEDELEKIRFDKNRIVSCVRAFEARQNLIQTIAANNRKEKN